MKARDDDFSRPVRRILAQRAGQRCSICGKATIGPGAMSDLVISDGIAAHITAASKGGPRFDDSLSSEQRRSAENGIWVCTHHGREIDADIPAYSVAALRGLKRIREEVARKERRTVESEPDATAGLIQLPYADNPYTLFELVKAQPYMYSTTAAIRQQLRTSKQGSSVLKFACEVIEGTWEYHQDVAGILSTLLSCNLDLWQPTPTVLDELETICEAGITADDWSTVALTEPLAFSLAAKGKPQTHRKVLERLIENSQWRAADASRVRNYYGTLGVEIAAIVRHWQDSYRKGLLAANDVGRLIDILLTSSEALKKQPTYYQLLELLGEQGNILRQHGEDKLGGRVHELVEALRLATSDDHPTLGPAPSEKSYSNL